MLLSDSTRTSTVLVAFAVNPSGEPGFADVTFTKSPDPTRTAMLEFRSETVGVSVTADTEFATVAL